jgi:hypothetical protein
MLSIVKDSSLVLNLDAGDTNSYSGSGTTWTDRSTQAGSFTLTNGPTFTAPTSTVGANITFDGVDDYAEDGGTNALKTISNGSDFTIDVWIKFNSASVTQAICSNGNASAGSFGFALVAVPSSGSLLLRMQVITSSTIYFLTSSAGSSFSTGTWRNLVARFDYDIGGGSSEYTVYSNNSLHTTVTSSQPSGTLGNSTNNFRIARRPNNIQTANINIGALKIYNRLLTTTEIAQNYNALRGRFGL